MNNKEKATYKILYSTWRECSRQAIAQSTYAGYDDESDLYEMDSWAAEEDAFNALVAFIDEHDLAGTEYDVDRAAY